MGRNVDRMNAKSAWRYASTALLVSVFGWLVISAFSFGYHASLFEPYVLARLTRNTPYLEYVGARSRYWSWDSKNSEGLEQRQFEEALAHHDPSRIEGVGPSPDETRMLVATLIHSWDSGNTSPIGRASAMKELLMWGAVHSSSILVNREGHGFCGAAQVLNEPDRLSRLLSGEIEAVNQKLPVKTPEVMTFEEWRKAPPLAGSLQAIIITHWVLDSLFFALMYALVGYLSYWIGRRHPEQKWSRPFAGSPKAWNVISAFLPGFAIVRLLDSLIRFLVLRWQLHQLTE